MPFVTNTQNTAIVAANTVMSRAFFPRAKEWLYPKLAGSYVSVRLVEPHSMIGSVPPMSLFNGQLKSKMLPSYSMNIPNLLYKNILDISQTEFEGDQTGALLQLSQAMGIRLAELPDQIFCKRLLTGSSTTSVTQTFRGTPYTVTFDGQPFFSTSHPGAANNGPNGTQSNIISGNLPSTIAGLLAQDYATSANQLLRDLQTVLNTIKTVVDTAGIPIFPTIDTKKSIVVVVPPILEPIAKLAFIPGSAQAVINQTTNIAPMFVRDVLTSGFLAGGWPDPEPGSTGGNVSPVNPTDYYVFVVDDWVRPFYTQLFRPLATDEMFPPGYDAGAEVDRIIKSNSDIDVEPATLFASTRVDTTFRRIGAEADRATIESDAFTVSCRHRMNVAYGPWFTGYRIYPSGGTINPDSSSSA